MRFLVVAFVCAFVSAHAVDTVYVNGTVLTMDAENSIARGVAVQGNAIVAVGSNAVVRGLITADTRVVDLDGRTMLPGFIDAHGHFNIAAMNDLYRVDLNSPPIGTVNTMGDVLDRLRAKAATTPEGEWIVGMSYDDTLIAEGRHPTRVDLDSVSTEHPIIALHISLHIAVVNSLVLEMLDYTAETPQPTGGHIRMDAETGEPNGILEEIPAFGPVLVMVPPAPMSEQLDSINFEARKYAKAGVTTVQNGAATIPEIHASIEAARIGYMPLRTVIFPNWQAGAQVLSGKLAVDEALSDRVIMGAIKIVADGSIQGYTGYLKEPYHVPFKGDAEYRGYPGIPRDRLVTMVDTVHGKGLQLAIHGNGDASIDDILFAIEEAQLKHPRDDARHVIIHAQMAREDQLDKMKELGVSPSFFVLHTYYWGDRHRDIFMGPERAARMSPLHSAQEIELRYTIHCRISVVPMEPLRLVWSAVNRISTSGATIGAEQRVSPMQALRAVTIEAAWQCFQEERIGSIEVGKLADLVIVSENPLTYPTRIDEIEVLETIVDGETVYRKLR